MFADKKTRLVVGLEICIAFIFVIGARWTTRTIYVVYQSYFADIALPFGFYFLLMLKAHEHGFFNSWRKRALAVFALCAASETLQYFGIYALATVFDPLDFVMYFLGVLLAAVVDRQVFAKSYSFWN